MCVEMKALFKKLVCSNYGPLCKVGVVGEVFNLSEATH